MASTGAPVPGSVTVTGLSNGVAYHWRARVRDAGGQVSAWVSFGGNAETSRDAAVDLTPPSGSVKIDRSAAWSDSPTVSLALRCTDAQSGRGAMQLSNDNVAFTPPEPFVATRTWTLAGGDATKTVYVRYVDRAGNVSKSFLDTIVLDTTGPVVGAISATPNPFSPPLGQTTAIGIPVSDNLSASCALRIRILDSAGGSVRTLSRTVSCPPAGATTSVVWTGAARRVRGCRPAPTRSKSRPPTTPATRGQWPAAPGGAVAAQKRRRSGRAPPGGLLTTGGARRSRAGGAGRVGGARDWSRLALLPSRARSGERGARSAIAREALPIPASISR